MALSKKNITKILEDFAAVKTYSEQCYESYDLINSLFCPNYEYSLEVSEFRLANNESEVAFNELVNFIIGTVYPTDGSWVNHIPEEDSHENIVKSKLMCEDLATRLRYDTNFYEEIYGTISEGLMWKRGFVDTKYANGLWFMRFPGGAIHISKSKGNLRRSYAETDMSLKDINATYKGLPTNLVDAAEKQSSGGEEHTVIQCIIPNTKEWFDNLVGGVKFRDIKILKETQTELTSRTAIVGYSSFPIHIYQLDSVRSPVQMAVHSAAFANFYEKIALERARIINYPSMTVDKENYRSNTYGFRPGDVNPVREGEHVPQAIQSLTAGDPHNHEVIRMKVDQVERIFKTKEIRALQLQGMSQYEYNTVKHRLLTSLVPLTSGLSVGFSASILERAHNLYLKHDKQYKDKFEGIKGRFICNGLDEEIKRAKQLAGIGQFGQLIAPYVPLGQAELQATINPMAIAALGAYGNNVPEVLHSPDVVEAQLQADAQAQQMNEQLEQTKMASDINATNTKAEESKDGN